jgi:hypothetical protein
MQNFRQNTVILEFDRTLTHVMVQNMPPFTMETWIAKSHPSCGFTLNALQEMHWEAYVATVGHNSNVL